MAKAKKSVPSDAAGAPLVLARTALQSAFAEYAAARRSFARAFREYKAAAPAVTDKLFWAVMADYRDALAWWLRTDRRQAVPLAARELARRASVGVGAFSVRGVARPHSLAVLAAFNRQYDGLVDRLTQAFDANDALELGRGDDSFSDMVGALPVAGKAVCDNVLGGKYRDAAAFERAVRAAVHAVSPALGRLILEDEHYHDEELDRALRRHLLWELQEESDNARQS